LKVPVKTWLLPVLAILQTTLLTNAEIRADQFETSMTIGTWGGPYEAAQENALFAPFEQSSGIDIRISHYTGGLDIFDQPSPPDILDMLKEDAELACEKKLLKPIDLASLSQARISNKSAQKALHAGELDTTDDFAKHDFYEGVFAPCSVAHSTFSTLIAYDERAFTGEKPTRINDLFDLERFPGKRALQRSPAALFEWAMMAEDVPTSQIYDLLSTERGLRLVLKNLEKLRDHIIWWETPEDAVSLLEQGEAVMASGYNGRFFNAWSRGVPINMIWDGQIIDRSVWAIASTSTINTNNALSFLRFALHPQRLAHMARQIPYGPLRPSAFRYIGLNQDTGIDMRDHLPTADHHLTNALHRDTRWYARTFSLRHTYFTRWVEANGE
jgi:putative spermidine/putrescine transport system substrate-binding protein